MPVNAHVDQSVWKDRLKNSSDDAKKGGQGPKIDHMASQAPSKGERPFRGQLTGARVLGKKKSERPHGKKERGNQKKGKGQETKQSKDDSMWTLKRQARRRVGGGRK